MSGPLSEDSARSTSRWSRRIIGPFTLRHLAIVGVAHSHTHSDAYPSPTDVGQAPDPAWHYVIVSLRDAEPVLRSFRIVDESITEEPVALRR